MRTFELESRSHISTGLLRSRAEVFHHLFGALGGDSLVVIPATRYTRNINERNIQFKSQALPKNDVKSRFKHRKEMIALNAVSRILSTLKRPCSQMMREFKGTRERAIRGGNSSPLDEDPLGCVRKW